MTLPFSDESARRFFCFVCGIGFKFDEFADYKKHIIAEHEEGREFLLCPLVRCGQPVRDLRVHFKSNHPVDMLPKNIQHKVIVWRDFNTKKRKKMQFADGYFQSAKNGKNMHYRSSWELKVYESLEKLNNVVAYQVEPFYITYFYKGKSHKYWPDILVHYEDGTKKCLEIKPGNQTTSDINRAKWEAAAEYCLARGFLFAVLTEKGIANLILEVKSQ